MPLVTTQALLKDAYQNHYAVGAFAAHNLEILKAIVEAGETLKAPIIIQTTPGTIRYTGIRYVVSMVRTAAEMSKIPIALHLDHGDHFETVCKCLHAGYTSIMIDGSSYSFEENINLVRKTVDAAHSVGVPVEAELGTIGGVEDDLVVGDEDAGLTDPEAAVEFVNRTGIDSFAPAFGTAHGLYKKEPNLDFDRLKEISERVGIPIVMHGASGVPVEGVRKAIQLGASKVNFSTELKEVFAQELRRHLNDNPQESDPRKYFQSARHQVKSLVERKIEVLQSAKIANV